MQSKPRESARAKVKETKICGRSKEEAKTKVTTTGKKRRGGGNKGKQEWKENQEELET